MTDFKLRAHSTQVGPQPRRRHDPESAWVIDAYRTYFRSTWTLVGRLGVPANSIEDVVQEVFLILHRRRHDFRNESSVRTWVHGIAIRVARHHRARLRRREMEPLPSQTHAETPPLESAIDGRAQLKRLDALLGELSEEQREVFVLVEVGGLSAPEVAQAMGTKLNTVYSRLRLARSRMKASLEAMQNEGAHGAA